MQNFNKNKKGGPVSTSQGGFIELIVLIVVALLIMKYFNFTLTDMVNWFKSFFSSVLR